MSDTRLENLIVGHSGQDGILLRQQLDVKGVGWAGISSSEGAASAGASIDWFDVSDPVAVGAFIRSQRPRHIYYLAAVHKSSLKTDSPDLYDAYDKELTVNVQGPLNCLEAVRAHSPDSRLLFASSSLVFAPTENPGERITEGSRLAPQESYAIEKLLAGGACKDYREQHGQFVAVAYLFNHESTFRRPGYFSRQLVSGIHGILRGERQDLEIGDLNAVVDWSYAGDVVAAMQAILAHDVAGDYVVASGIGHTIGDFLQIAFDYTGLDMDGRIRVNPSLLGRTNSCRIGDAALLRTTTGWKPKMDFETLVCHLLDADDQNNEA